MEQEKIHVLAQSYPDKENTFHLDPTVWQRVERVRDHSGQLRSRPPMHMAARDRTSRRNPKSQIKPVISLKLKIDPL
jgi:hypothetical protein